MRKLWPVCLLLIVVASSDLTSAQDSPTFQLTHQLGRGHIQSIEWHPTNDVLLVSTIRGAWFHDSLLRDLGHIEAARLATFSPDGALVAGVDAENQITLWNSETYAPVGALSGHEALVTAMAWSPTGEQLATGDKLGNVMLWDVGLRREISRWQVSEMISLMRWSPAGSYLAVLSADHKNRVWDVSAEEIIFEQECCSLDIAWVNDTQLARTPIEESSDRNVWDVQTGERVFYGLYDGYLPPLSIRLPWKGIAALSKDATQIATTYRWLHPKMLAPIYIKEITDLESSYSLSGEVELAGHYFAVEHIVWNNTDTLLASAGDYGDLKVWNTNSGELVASNSIGHVQSDPFQPYWLSIMNPTVFGLPVWSPDSQMLAIPDNLNTVAIWDITTRKTVSLLSTHEIRVVQMAWHPDNELLATTTGWTLPEEYDRLTRIWHVPTGTLIDQYENTDSPIAWHPDGSFLVGAAGANLLSVWQTASQQLGEPLTISDLSRIDFVERISAEGLEWDASGSNLIVHYDGNSGHRITTFKYPELTPATAISTHPHSAYWARSVWSEDGTQQYVARWSGRMGAADTSGKNHPIDLFTYSLLLEDLPSYDPLSTVELNGHTGEITAIVWSPNGQYLVSSSEDGTSRLWTNSAEPNAATLPYLERVTWSPDSEFIGGFNTDAQGWLIINRHTQEIVQNLPISSWNQGYIVWSPDSQKIAQVVDGVVFIWE